jgi:hypothetical protein
MADFQIKRDAETGMHCVMKGDTKVKCHPTKAAAMVHVEMLTKGSYSDVPAVAESAKGWELQMQYLIDAAKEAPPNLAPYKIFPTPDGKFQVKNNKGEVKATFKTRAEALKYQRALYVNVEGAPGKAAKKPWSGTQKRAS